ncbi:hypothetical protein TNCV_4226731 [Trichonephila clavipes]|nr:hypothetical protein TNCV_4226731 [Trichonephila clavipes]
MRFRLKWCHARTTQVTEWQGVGCFLRRKRSCFCVSNDSHRATDVSIEYGTNVVICPIRPHAWNTPSYDNEASWFGAPSCSISSHL